jgi:xanthine dehydrogenase accessory factor
MAIDQIADAIRGVIDDGSRATLITVARSELLAVGGKILVKENSEAAGDLGDAALNAAVVEPAILFLRTRDEAKLANVSEFAPELGELADSMLLFERIEAEPHLVIAGAGHVGASLARLAALIGYRVTLIDDRAEFVARELFSTTADANIELVSANDWAESITEAIGNGHGVAVAIVTRGHKQDEDCLRAASSANPDYIGMIGSKRRTNIVLETLRTEGFDPQLLTKVRAPIGLDIGAVSPEEVAVAILAEIIAERRGGSGGSLSSWRRAG